MPVEVTTVELGYTNETINVEVVPAGSGLRMLPTLNWKLNWSESSEGKPSLIVSMLAPEAHANVEGAPIQ